MGEPTEREWLEGLRPEDQEVRQSEAERLGELRADIARERERRHWTIDQWRKVAGPEEWPRAMAQCQLEADTAVDALQAQVEHLEAERLNVIVLVDRAERAEAEVERAQSLAQQIRNRAERSERREDALGLTIYELQRQVEIANTNLKLVCERLEQAKKREAALRKAALKEVESDDG